MPGRVVLLRADMDALPVKEETGLVYARHVHQKNDAGETVSEPWPHCSRMLRPNGRARLSAFSGPTMRKVQAPKPW